MIYYIHMLIIAISVFISIASRDMFKRLIALSIMQTGVLFFFISMGYRISDVIPIEKIDRGTNYANPLPHTLMLTAIVVGLATSAVGLALLMRIKEKFGTINDIEFKDKI